MLAMIVGWAQFEGDHLQVSSPYKLRRAEIRVDQKRPAFTEDCYSIFCRFAPQDARRIRNEMIAGRQAVVRVYMRNRNWVDVRTASLSGFARLWQKIAKRPRN
jgi:hypothetical protein